MPPAKKTTKKAAKKTTSRRPSGSLYEVVSGRLAADRGAVIEPGPDVNVRALVNAGHLRPVNKKAD